jgi:hypothetical protein
MNSESGLARAGKNARPVELGEEWPGDEAVAEQEALTADGDGPSVPDRPPGANRPFPDGSVAAIYSGQSTATGELHGGVPLISGEARSAFLSRWAEIQVSFVDDPGRCLENAYALTQEVGLAVLESFTDRSAELADGWREAYGTEQLRLMLKQYRDFLGVLLPR